MFKLKWNKFYMKYVKAIKIQSKRNLEIKVETLPRMDGNQQNQADKNNDFISTSKKERILV